MNQQEFVNILSEEFNLTPAQTGRILKITLDQISQVMLSKERLYIQSFGYFETVLRQPKKFRNISTGKIETAPAHYDIVFHTSASLRKKLNKIPPKVVEVAFPPEVDQPSAEAPKKVPEHKPKPKRKFKLKHLIKLST